MDDRRRLELVEAELVRLRAAGTRRARWLAAVVVLTGTAVVAQSGSLIVFTADGPALAADVNANFALLKAWLEQKVGPVGTSAITVTSVAGGLTGTQLAPNTVTSGNLTDNAVASVDIQDGTIANADLGDDLRCPDGSRQTYGQCIFYRPVSAPFYVYTFRDAANACRVERARLCSEAEVSAAQGAGYELCALGWFADRPSDTTGRRGYPMQTVASGCGTAGINASTQALTQLNGAWCCK